jgi:flagellar hook-length control protein FliK
MLPIVAPAIAAPAVAPASAAPVEGGQPVGSPAATGLTAANVAAEQGGIDPGLFALLLAPLAGPVATVAPAPTLATDEAPSTDVGLAQLLSTLRVDPSPAGEDASEDGALLALLASFGAAAPASPQSILPGQPASEISAPAVAPAVWPPVDAMAGAPAEAKPAQAMPQDLLAEMPAPPVVAAGTTAVVVPAGAMPASDAAVPDPASPPSDVPQRGAGAAPAAAAAMAPALPVPTDGTAIVVSGSVEDAAPAVAAVIQPADAGRKPAPAPLQRGHALQPPMAAAAPLAAVAASPDEDLASEPAIAPAPSQPPVEAAASSPDPLAMATTQPPTVPGAVIAPSTTTVATSPNANSPAAPPPPAPRTGAIAAPDPEVEAPAESIPGTAPIAPAPAAAGTAASDGSIQALAPAPRAEPPSAIARSEPAPPASRPEANPLERAVAHQVSRAIVQHLPDGGARMVMRLTPPELGTVRIEFISRDGMVTARLMAEDEGVRQALDRALPHIRAEVRSDHPGVDISVDRSDQRQAWSEGHARQERRDEPRAGQGRRPREDDPVFTIDGAEPVAVATPLRAPQQLGGRVGPTLVDALA